MDEYNSIQLALLMLQDFIVPRVQETVLKELKITKLDFVYTYCIMGMDPSKKRKTMLSNLEMS